MSDVYAELGAEIGKMVTEKQAAYGDSYGRSGEVLRCLFPNGIPAERYTDCLAIVRVVDKLFRVATDRDALGEDPWKDIAGYALLSIRQAPEAPQDDWIQCPLCVRPLSVCNDDPCAARAEIEI
jgi:hypothetical protein